VFRSRAKEEKAPAAKAPVTDSKQTRDPQAPKGRPTPKRSMAQGQRRSVSHTPLTRKEAARRQRDARREQLERQRAALAGSGNERDLPPRDQGPVRKFVRNFVDSRFHVAEFFLPLAVVILVLVMVRVGAVQSIALLLWLTVIILIVINSVVTSIRLRKELATRFPGQSTRGAVAYALMRTLQMRRMRVPKPKVKRGERP
jgi:hypothetical protein